MLNSESGTRTVTRALMAFPFVAVSAALVGALTGYAYDWLSLATGLEMDFGGDKTNVFLGVFLGLPLGAAAGLAVSHRIIDRRRIRIGEAVTALLLGAVGGVPAIALFDLFGGLVGLLVAPFVVAAMSTVGFVAFRVIRHRQ